MNKRTWAELTEAAKAMLLRRNPGLQSKVARTLDVSEGLVSRVWWGKAKSARILTAILRKVNELMTNEDPYDSYFDTPRRPRLDQQITR